MTVKKVNVTKSEVVNYLQGLRCDTNWSIAGAIEQDREKYFIEALKREACVINYLLQMAKRREN
jgi:hypothetical protein